MESELVKGGWGEKLLWPRATNPLSHIVCLPNALVGMITVSFQTPQLSTLPIDVPTRSTLLNQAFGTDFSVGGPLGQGATTGGWAWGFRMPVFVVVVLLVWGACVWESHGGG